MWSYRVGNGPNFLSPVLSLDGRKLALISSSTPNANFNVLTWVAGQGTVQHHLSRREPVAPGHRPRLHQRIDRRMHGKRSRG